MKEEGAGSTQSQPLRSFLPPCRRGWRGTTPPAAPSQPVLGSRDDSRGALVGIIGYNMGDRAVFRSHPFLQCCLLHEITSRLSRLLPSCANSPDTIPPPPSPSGHTNCRQGLKQTQAVQISVNPKEKLMHKPTALSCLHPSHRQLSNRHKRLLKAAKNPYPVCKGDSSCSNIAKQT